MTRCVRPLVATTLFLLYSAAASAQLAPEDSRAVSTLTQAFAVPGASTASGTQGFSGSGSIVYYWAGEEVRGSVSIRERGVDQFRLDAVLPEGTRSWAVSQGAGSIKDSDGTSTKIRSYNALNSGAIANPLARIASLIKETGTQISYVGLETAEGRLVHHVRLQPALRPDEKPLGDYAAPLKRLDVFIDSKSFLILKTQDFIHGENNVRDTYARELNFADYRLANGALLPFSVSETFAGQRTWALQLDTISTNSGLTDSDFTL